jgi:hypothetical protein
MIGFEVEFKNRLPHRSAAMAAAQLKRKYEKARYY